MAIRVSITVVFLFVLTACSSASSDAQPGPPPPEFDEAFAIGITEDRESALLTFKPDSELAETRGLDWRLEQWNGSTWESKWILAGEAFTIQEWSGGPYSVGDVGLFGIGPDVVALPQLSTGEYHRICHGPDDSTVPSGCGTVPFEPTEPNSAATTTPEPSTTIAIDG